MCSTDQLRSIRICTPAFSGFLRRQGGRRAVRFFYILGLRTRLSVRRAFGHGYLYGEHFAVDPSRRGGGTGTAVLDYIKGLGRPMLLEIELPVEDDEMTFRRKLFYERNGFILNPWHHVQPAYHDDSVPVEMHIMSWPYVFSKEEKEEYETFRADQAGIMP